MSSYTEKQLGQMSVDKLEAMAKTMGAQYKAFKTKRRTKKRIVEAILDTQQSTVEPQPPPIKGEQPQFFNGQAPQPTQQPQQPVPQQQQQPSSSHSSIIDEIEQHKQGLSAQGQTFSGEQETLLNTIKQNPNMSPEQLQSLKQQIVSPTASINLEQEQTAQQETDIMNENLGEQTKKDAKAETKEEEPHMEKVERPDAEKILNSRSGIHFAQDIKKPTDMFKDGKKVIPSSVKDNKVELPILGDDDTQEEEKAGLEPVDKQTSTHRMIMDYTKKICFRKSSKQKQLRKERHSVY